MAITCIIRYRENYHFAREHQFIRTEDRLFTKPVAGPHAPGGTA